MTLINFASSPYPRNKLFLMAIFMLSTFISVMACGGGGGEDWLEPPYCFLSIGRSETRTLRVGETIGPNATLYCGSYPGERVSVIASWSSSNNNVATVVDGIMTAISEGSATIAAKTKYEGKKFSDSIEVTVVSGCNIVPVFDEPPQISADPDVAAIQNFNRLLIEPDVTLDQLVPYVSEDYYHAGVDYYTFIGSNYNIRPQVNSLQNIIDRVWPGGYSCGWFARMSNVCSIGIEKEEIRLNGDTAEDVIVIVIGGTAGEAESNLPLFKIARLAKQFDFIKENDGVWRFTSLRSISGKTLQAFGGAPSLEINATFLPSDQFNINEEIIVSANIQEANEISVILQPPPEIHGTHCWGPDWIQGNTINDSFPFLKDDFPRPIPADCLPSGIDFVRIDIGGNIENFDSNDQEYSSIIFESYVILSPGAPICDDEDPNPPDIPDPAPTDKDNLCRDQDVVVQASSSYTGFGPERAIDGNLNTSWFTEVGDAANLGKTPYYEIVLPANAMIWKINMFGNRQYKNGYDFFSGIFEIFNENDELLYDSGIVNLPSPNRDISLDLPNINEVRRVRFTAVDDESSEPGFSEIEIIGEFQ